MFTPSGKVVAATAAAFLVAGAVAHYPERVAVGFACLLALVTGLWWVLLRPDLVASRVVTPPWVTEGEPARAVLTLTNEGTRRSPRQPARYGLPTDHRGLYRVGPRTMARSDPLRLVSVAQPLALDGPAGDAHGAPQRGAQRAAADGGPGHERGALRRRLVRGRRAGGRLAVRGGVRGRLPAGVPHHRRRGHGCRPHRRRAIMDLLAGIERSDDDPGLVALTGMVPEEAGVSLGVVTGQAAVDQLGSISAVRSRFDMVSLVMVGEEFERPVLAVSGGYVDNCRTSEDFALAGNAGVRR
jgi:hypothetical protein